MKLDTEILEELEAIASRCGCELLRAEYRGGTLQLTLDKPDGVTLKECSQVSREASAFLDVVDFGTGNYTLEVSSPGLDREFYSENDYRRFVGESVRISWLEDGAKRTDSGCLRRYQPDTDGGPEIELELADGIRKIQLDRVLKTRLEPKF